MSYIATGITGLDMIKPIGSGGRTTLAAKDPDALQIRTRSVEDQCRDYLPSEQLVPICAQIMKQCPNDRPIDIAKALLGQTATQPSACQKALAEEVRAQIEVVKSPPKSRLPLYLALGGAGLLAVLWLRRRKKTP